MKPKSFVLFLLIIIACVLPVLAADVDFPYGTINFKVPPSEDPVPGFGEYYTTISKGMSTALWNPASLGKLKLSEASLSGTTALDTYNLQKGFKVNEMGGAFSTGSGSTTTAGNYGLFFRSPSAMGSGINTKEVEILTHASYASAGTGMNFSSALKVNDWLAVGFATNSPTQMDSNLAGNFPLTARANTNLYGQSMGEMQIQNNGKIKYTFSSGAIVTTYESTSSLWSGFLSQEATLPLTTLSEIRNNINIQSPYLGTIASKLGNVYVGLNLLPISATANINNDLRTMVNSDASDVFLYVPNFDTNNQTELANWINDPDQYGKSTGYLRKQIRLPAGEIVTDTKYKGYYSASTARLDLGAMYDVSDWFTLGFALENLNSSSLNFKGSGLAAYINYREIDTLEAGSLTDLLTPGGKRTIDVVTDRWVTTFEAGGYDLYLEPEKTFNLPKRTRLGFTLKKPFLIAVDYEQNQTPITIGGSTEATNINISNLNFLRIGMELPLAIRVGTTLMFKPSISGGIDPSTQKSINTFFKFGVLPTKLDAGTTLNLWGYEIGGSSGVDLMPVLNLLQFDITNIDLGKSSYFSTYVKKDAWQINFLSQLDALSTASAYYNKPVAAGATRSIEYSDIKYINTLGITYHF